jgi:CTP:molybdopterin cytidylyltransferase MocA
MKRIIRAVRIEDAARSATAALASGTAARAEMELRRGLVAALGDEPLVRDGLLTGL